MMESPGFPGPMWLVGESAVMARLWEEISRIAPTDAKVLITGESGVGKELVAREIHAHSARAGRRMVVVNCAGFPETLLESELFGHFRGSFTGAHRDKAGKLEAAHEGIAFLDEIGDMTPRMQALLLRFLETGEIQKIGGDGPGRRVNVRIVAATNRSLAELIAQGRFRQDLFYRLNVVHIDVPPLRNRKQDVPLLVRHFLQRVRSVRGSADREVTPDAMAALVAHSWPGNVRELENAVERMAISSRGGVIDLHHLPLTIGSGSRGRLLVFGERRRTVVDQLYERIVDERQSFWTAVYPLYMRRDITREQVRTLVARALRDSSGSYRMVTRLFQIEPEQYKKFLNFLRTQGCQPSFKEYR